VPVKAKPSKRIATERNDARPARLVRLRPIGFPVREMHRNYFVNIEKPDLFELYAKEQWMGSIVCEDEYLFDQRVIPDFAYQVIRVLPTGAVKINEATIIEIDPDELKNQQSPDESHVKLDDVIGHRSVKDKCKILMKYLDDPGLFGEWAPKNVLFYGTPGTGKTMTARALANEVKARFIMVRATDLVGEFVGDGSKRIHDLYSTALDSAPTVVFIDEMDAIALDRSFQAVRGDVSEVVNALLSELDGIRVNAGVVTIAATNSPILLDKAIRSRFEEELEFKAPDTDERLQILEHYARTLPIPVSADLNSYAVKTKGFSGRDIKEKLLKAALFKAILEDAEEVTEGHMDAAFKEITVALSRPPGEMFT